MRVIILSANCPAAHKPDIYPFKERHTFGRPIARQSRLASAVLSSVFGVAFTYPESDNGDSIPRGHLDGRLDRRERHGCGMETEMTRWRRQSRLSRLVSSGKRRTSSIYKNERLPAINVGGDSDITAGIWPRSECPKAVGHFG